MRILEIPVSLNSYEGKPFFHVRKKFRDMRDLQFIIDAILNEKTVVVNFRIKDKLEFQNALIQKGLVVKVPDKSRWEFILE